MTMVMTIKGCGIESHDDGCDDDEVGCGGAVLMSVEMLMKGVVLKAMATVMIMIKL